MIRLDFRRSLGSGRAPPSGVSAGSFPETAASNRAYSVIGLKTIAAHSANQMQKQNHLYDLLVRVAPRQLDVFASGSHWFIVLFTFVVIGRCNCFGFGFTTLN